MLSTRRTHFGSLLKKHNAESWLGLISRVVAVFASVCHLRVPRTRKSKKGSYLVFGTTSVPAWQS